MVRSELKTHFIKQNLTKTGFDEFDENIHKTQRSLDENVEKG